MRTLKELLPQKKNILPTQDIDEKTIFHILKKVIIEEYGIRGSENILPSRYKEKKLFLTFRSSLWANEVWVQRESLRQRINTILGSEAVKEIKVFG